MRARPGVAAPLTALAAVVAAFAVVGAVDPNEPGAYPPCPVASLTGLHCPGCGGLRSAHALAHGDPVAALDANALAVAGFALLAAALLAWLARPWTARWSARASAHRAGSSPSRSPRPGGAGRSRGVPRLVPALLLAATASFTLVRNLPLGAALAP
ncbi:DUF2752 domain-containing protein [Streptomyces sp. 4N509B]|uniref:DUF2752 domain-containing protein n=1 Tax=Streptomyces sp. 4N509B TaxID=3457413 RepID=UPI003FD591A1